jgi:hypothetical protein
MLLLDLPFLHRITIFDASSGSCLCSAFASSHGARIHMSRSSSVVRITGSAFGWIGATIAWVSGPLSAFATGFADHITRQGYSPHQTRIQLLLLNHLSNSLVSKRLDAGELRAKEVEQFQLSRHEAGYRFLRSIRAMQPILG